MMNFKIILTAFTTFVTESSLVQAKDVGAACDVAGPDNTCPGGSASTPVGWCSTTKTCCQSKDGISCASFVPAKYYKAQPYC